MKKKKRKKNKNEKQGNVTTEDEPVEWKTKKNPGKVEEPKQTMTKERLDPRRLDTGSRRAA